MLLKKSVQIFESQIIIETLRRLKGNQTKTAKALGIHRNSLIFKMHRYGIYGKTNRWDDQK